MTIINILKKKEVAILLAIVALLFVTNLTTYRVTKHVQEQKYELRENQIKIALQEKELEVQKLNKELAEEVKATEKELDSTVEVREVIVKEFVPKYVNTICPDIGLSKHGVQTLNRIIEARK